MRLDKFIDPVNRGFLAGPEIYSSGTFSFFRTHPAVIVSCYKIYSIGLRPRGYKQSKKKLLY